MIQKYLHQVTDTLSLDVEVTGRPMREVRLMDTYEWHERRMRWIREGKLK